MGKGQKRDGDSTSTVDASSHFDTSVVTLKRGSRFIHASWLDENKQPLACVVTRVALGSVYWKCEGERKARQYFPLEKAFKYVKEVL